MVMNIVNKLAIFGCLITASIAYDKDPLEGVKITSAKDAPIQYEKIYLPTKDTKTYENLVEFYTESAKEVYGEAYDPTIDPHWLAQAHLEIAQNKTAYHGWFLKSSKGTLCGLVDIAKYDDSSCDTSITSPLLKVTPSLKDLPLYNFYFDVMNGISYDALSASIKDTLFPTLQKFLAPSRKICLILAVFPIQVTFINLAKEWGFTITSITAEVPFPPTTKTLSEIILYKVIGGAEKS